MKLPKLSLKIMKRKFPKIIYFLVCFLLILEQSGFAQIAGQLDISGYFTGLNNVLVQDKFRPPHLRYLAYDNINNNFKLLLDKGDFEKEQGLSPKGTVTENKLESSTKELLNYFFIGISLPNDSFWVNLRPDSPDNMIDPYLAQTDVGKILLEADLQLKKDTGLATSPQTPAGRAYWNKLYKKAGELFGTESITIPTLTRPWIVPGEIIIRESTDNAYIYKATLKVMLESDYLNSTNPAITTSADYSFKDERLKKLNEYSSQLIRDTIIPKLTKEINTAKRYAPLRQVYYSLILAQWFKQKFYGKDGLYSRLIDKKNLTQLTSKGSWDKQLYFKAYQDSFNKGEYNLTESVYTAQGKVIRSYMSGGLDFSRINIASLPINSSRPFLTLIKPYTSNPVNASGGTAENPFAGITIMPEFASSPLVYSSIKNAVESLPEEIQKNLDAGAMSIRAIVNWLQKVYELHSGLLFDFYHNQGHNAGAGYIFLLFLNNLKEATPRDINTGLLAALLHDFHSRIPEGDKGVPAYVPETILQIQDLMGIKEYAVPAKKEIPSSYKEKIPEGLKNEFRKYLNDIFGQEGRRDLYNEIEAMILRTDYASDVAQAKAEYKNAATEIRQRMDLLLNNSENRENLEKIINIVAGAYNDLKSKAGLEADKVAYDWLVRQEGIELAYLGALSKVNPQRRKIIHAMSILLEIADQTSFYVLLDKEAIEREVVPGLRKEGVMASSEGSYKFFFVPQFLSKPEVMAVLKTLPMEYRENFVNTMEYFSRLGKASEDWNFIKDDMYYKLGLQLSSSPVKAEFSGGEIFNDLSYLDNVAMETSRLDEDFKEKVFLLFGTKTGERYQIKRIIPVLKYIKQTYGYVENDPAYIAELIDKYATGEVKLLGVLHTHPYDLTKIITKPGPSWQDRLGEDILLPGRSEKITDIPLGVVIEAAVPEDISLEGLQNMTPDLNAYLYLPEEKAGVKTIDVFRTLNFKEWIGQAGGNSNAVPSAIKQSTASSPVVYFDAEQAEAMDLLRSDGRAWVIFADMLKLSLRNDYYGTGIADIFIADGIRIIKNVLSKHKGIGFRLGERSDEVGMVLPGSLDQEEVRGVLENIQYEIEKEYRDYCIARLPDGMIDKIKGSNGVRIAQRTAREPQEGGQEYITTVFFLKDSGDIIGRSTLDRILGESGQVPGAGEVEQALPPYLPAGAARFQGEGVFENKFESSLKEAEIFQRVAKLSGQLVGVEGLQERPQIKEGAMLPDYAFSKLEEYIDEFNRSLPSLREFVRIRYGDNAAKQVRLDNGYAAFMRQNLFVVLEYAMEKMKSSDSFIFAVRGPPDNFYIITSGKGKWQVTAIRQDILTAEGATFEESFLSIMESSGRGLRAAGKFPFKVINDFDELGHYFGNQLIKLDNINLLGSFNNQMHRVKEGDGILDAQSINEALGNASKNINNLLIENEFDFSVNFEAIAVTSDDFSRGKNQSNADIAREILNIIEKLNSARKTVEIPANSAKFYSEYRDLWQEVENEIKLIVAKKAKNAGIGLKEAHRNIDMPGEILASSPVEDKKSVSSSPDELRARFNTYLKNEGLDQYANLKNLFSNETMEILINDRSAKPVFLLALEKSDTGSLKFRDLEPARKLLGYQDIGKVKELIYSYSALGIGSAGAANELAGKGRKIIVGITDRYTSEEFTLIPNYRVASNRRCFIPLPEGLFLSIKGSGQNSYSSRPAYYINTRKGKRIEGAVGMDEISELGVGDVSLKESGMSMDLGYLPINNKLIGLEDANEENVAIVFSLSLDYHRLSKLPQLIANKGLDFLCERISGVLDAIGELDNVADKLHIKLSSDRILKPDQLMLVVMLNMGKAEAYKQNNGLYHETLHDQDVDFTGVTYDVEELIGTQYPEGYGENKELYLGGISQRVKILLKMLNAKDAKSLFPSPLETLKVLFKGYFENLNEEYLDLLRDNQSALVDIFQPLSDQYNERWFSVLGKKSPEEVSAEISRLLREELERRGKGISLPLGRESQPASSPITELRGAVQKLHNKKFNINGGTYVVSIENGDSVWDTSIVLRDKDNLEIGYFRLDTKSDAMNNGGMLQVIEEKRREGFALFILRKLREVFPENKELVTEIGHSESLKALRDNESINNVPIVQLFNAAGWELISLVYYDALGRDLKGDFSEQMSLDASRGEEGPVIARFKPKITQPYLPGFNYPAFASSPLGPDTQAKIREAKLFNENKFGLISKLGISINLSQPFSRRHVVIGDIHGDFEGLKQDLRDAGLVDIDGNWIGGDVVLIQMGDIIDRGEQSFEVYQYLSELRLKARAQGGDVKMLLGNHEYMFFLGMSGDSKRFSAWIDNLGRSELKDVLRDTIKNKGIGIARRMILTGESGEFAKWKKLYLGLSEDIKKGEILAAYEESGVLFVHGGITAKNKHGINARDQADFLNRQLAVKNFDGVRDALWNSFGYEVYGEGVNYLQIVAHTPELKEGAQVRSSPNGRVVNVDVGHWKDYGGNRGYAEINGDRLQAYALVKENAASSPAINLLEQSFNADNHRIAQFMIDPFSPATIGGSLKNRLIEATDSGQVIKLNLNNLSFDAPRFNQAMAIFNLLETILSEALFTKFKITSYDLRSAIRELLMNAFLHGNKLDFSLPIYLYFDFVNRKIEVYDLAVPQSQERERMKTEVESAGIGGKGTGLTLLRSLGWQYERVPVMGASDRQIGNKVVVYKTGQEENTGQGGIDFRALPIISQPALINQKVNANSISPIPLAELNSEWIQIENMLAAGITPSSERIKEYLQSCCQKQDFTQDIDKVLSCIAAMLRLEEERVVSTDLSLKEMLALLESGKPVNDMQLVLAQITVEAEEPKLIE